MDTVSGRVPTGQAGHEPSQSTLSRPIGDHPSREEGSAQTAIRLLGEAIRGRDAAWLVGVMHDFDQIPSREFRSRHPEVMLCIGATPAGLLNDGPLLAFLKMAAGIHHAAIAIETEGQDHEAGEPQS